ncbi:TPA: sporulation protein [Vibrio parahaemolyticus]|uniref:sporulation protein n=1 Tax=Vibrio parahaemolyticus TaxID=670 RepID=UPI0004139872|nr:sporulation protein [Vibrio parahaemolyticus]EME0891974.1 sporulation protein [Vibrio parahaemolyticus]KJR17806.1 Gram-positive sporulation control protein Spo0M [Vibrio parahaemolyticus]MBE4315818.1 sporulation protein [Vibrio parahaemolyticus]MBE5193841.1 sporulation protein [Vibrio parahaemolyticus]MCG6510012.1 sporulation protein [Vibrio parahaemolyticus]
MFKKLKASLGIGSAKVDTILDEMSVFQGATLKGHVHIKGGDVEQQIDAITIKLNTEMKVEVDDSVSYQTFTIDQLKAVDPFVIQPNEEKQVPFELKLHDETPITAVSALKNQCNVWVETTLDIDFAIDPRDRDYIEVKPLSVASRVIRAIEQAGFTMVKADVEKGFLRGGSFASRSGIYQELEFRNSGFVSSKEIELSFILEGQVMHCLAEIDRSLSFSGDQYRSFTLPINATDAQVAAAVAPTLSL